MVAKILARQIWEPKPIRLCILIYLLYVLYVPLLCVLGDDFVEQLKKSFRVPFGARSWLKLLVYKF